ncbi:hypothetical protein ACJJTC_019433 [Scirpophaga incertulas]
MMETSVLRHRHNLKSFPKRVACTLRAARALRRKRLARTPDHATQGRLSHVHVHAHDILWLSCNSDPWEEIIPKWKKIYELRKETEYENINDIFKHWPVLSDQRSDQLINIDFELMYPEKALNFYVNWDSFYENILKVRQTKDSSLSEVIKSLEHVEEDMKIPTQVYILGHLVPPKGGLT